MGQYVSAFLVPEAKAASNHTSPNKPNWITVHAVAAELSIAEVERLWLRFQQLGCDVTTGELSEANLQQNPIWQDAFARNILKKFMLGKSKIITFENFLRGLKWCEMSTLEEKLRGVFRVLNNGNDVPKEIFKKIIERVYTDPKDKDNLEKVTETLYKQMDPNNKGVITEAQFVQGCQSVPQDALEEILNFELLPDYMKEKLHQNLPEMVRKALNMNRFIQGNKFSSATPQPEQQAGGSGIPSDATLRKVAENIHKKDWERVANKLDFISDDIEDIKDEYPNNTKQQVFVMLQEWKSRDGGQASSTVLAKALNDCGMKQAAALVK